MLHIYPPCSLADISKPIANIAKISPKIPKNKSRVMPKLP
jgi:hypothetical protein